MPERLIAAARGETRGTADGFEAEIVPLRPRRGDVKPSLWRRWQLGLCPRCRARRADYRRRADLLRQRHAGAGQPSGEPESRPPSINSWLDNAAGNYKLIVNAGGAPLVDIPANGDNGEALQKISQNLPQQVRLPDLKPWGLSFRGARFVVVEGKPAAQLVYNTDNKAIGPLALIIGSSKEPDISPTFDKRQDLNLLYWRHQGRASVLVGQTEIG